MRRPGERSAVRGPGRGASNGEGEQNAYAGKTERRPASLEHSDRNRMPKMKRTDPGQII